MKRFAWILLVLAAAGPGCMNLAPLQDKPKAGPGVEEMTAAPAPRPVEPDQVTESNVRQTVQALRAELDRAATERPGAVTADMLKK
ncbi:MAG TPA: hypothetical protein VFE78_12300 [Gemmataceae bacterium]|nr:hypothetical protein [Gemmataceae bacterium]